MKQRQLKTNQRKSKRKTSNKDIVNIELDTKCSCSQSNDHASIQFTRRYLQCQGAMPIRILRLLIESILSYSPMIKMSIFDSNDRLLKDSDRLRSLKHTCSSSHHIPLRFTLINTVTSFAHCSCLSPLDELDSSPSPSIIQQETIEQILSTYSLPPQTSSSPTPSNSPIEIANLLTPPSLHIDCEPDTLMMDYITSKYGEICPSKTIAQEFAFDMPLDLSMKKHSLSPFDSQSRWIET